MRRRSRLLTLLMLAALTASAALAGSSGAQPSATQLQSRLAQQKALRGALSASVGSLSQLIDRLSGEVALVQRREADVRSQLATDSARLAGVRVDLARQRRLAALFGGRLKRAKAALAQQLISSYEAEPPDIVSVVLESHGFGDLLQRLDFLRIARDRQRAIIADTRTAKAVADAAARTLGALESRDAQITAGTAAQAQAISGMNQLLQARSATLRSARAARMLALHASGVRSRQMQQALSRLQAAQANSFGPTAGWAIPYAIVLCESGGQNLPPNGAGASGYYQIIPSTWAGAGGSGPAAYLAPKAEQDRVAAKLWDGGRGASNWVCAAIVHA